MRYHTLKHDCKKHTTLYCATFGMQTVNQVYDMMHRSPKNIIVPSSRYPCLKIGMTSTYRVLTSTYMYLHDLPESQNRRGRHDVNISGANTSPSQRLWNAFASPAPAGSLRPPWPGFQPLHWSTYKYWHEYWHVLTKYLHIIEGIWAHDPKNRNHYIYSDWEHRL